MSDKLSKPSGFNLTISTRALLYKIAAFLRVKRTKAIIKLFEILFEELINDREFRAYCDAWDKSQRHFDDSDKSSYTSFYIPQDYMKKFEDVMYDFGFIDRSPFLRLIIDYVYNHRVSPMEENVIPKIKKDIEGLGYKIEHIGPILDGKVYIYIDNPSKKTRRKKSGTK